MQAKCLRQGLVIFIAFVSDQFDVVTEVLLLRFRVAEEAAVSLAAAAKQSKALFRLGFRVRLVITKQHLY